jgi:hypothetical protein
MPVLMAIQPTVVFDRNGNWSWSVVSRLKYFRPSPACLHSLRLAHERVWWPVLIRSVVIFRNLCSSKDKQPSCLVLPVQSSNSVGSQHGSQIPLNREIKMTVWSWSTASTYACKDNNPSHSVQRKWSSESLDICRRAGYRVVPTLYKVAAFSNPENGLRSSSHCSVGHVMIK